MAEVCTDGVVWDALSIFVVGLILALVPLIIKLTYDEYRGLFRR